MSLIATWSPAFALFKQPWETGHFNIDVDRFARMIRGQLRAGPSRLEIRPRAEDVAAVVQNGRVAVDIECGPEHPDRPWTAKYPARARLRTIGLGNSEWALSYRWHEDAGVATAIGNLLDDNRVLKVYQNGPYYDIPVLDRYSLRTRNMRDTRDMRKALSATSRLGLKYLATIYDDAPPWAEDDGEDGDKVIFTQNWDELQTYNAWDCVETMRICDGMESEVSWNTPRVQRLYEVFHRLSWLAARMHAKGMYVHAENRQMLADTLLAEYEKREAALLQYVNIPGFRCTPNDMRSLIFKRHATPTVARFNLPDPVDPKLWSSETTIRVDQAALLMLYVDPGSPPELCRIVDLFWQAEGVWKARSASVVSDRISHAIGDDGRLHPAWNSCGTDTGRFACRDPNVTTLSKAKKAASNLGGDLPNLRQMYCAAPGKILIERDASQGELRVIAAVAEDTVLEQALATGDVYTEDAKAIFGLPAHLTKADIKPAARQAGKTGHLAFQYGAGLDAIYRQMVEVDRNMKYDMVRLVHEGLKRRYHRTVSYWHEEMERVRQTGYSESRVLHQRRVYPREPPITEVANYPIQSTMADIMNLAIIDLEERLPAGAEIVGQFHDAILVEAFEEDKDAVSEIMRECMERKHLINGKLFGFPTDMKFGYLWSEC